MGKVACRHDVICHVYSFSTEVNSHFLMLEIRIMEVSLSLNIVQLPIQMSLKWVYCRCTVSYKFCWRVCKRETLLIQFELCIGAKMYSLLAIQPCTTKDTDDTHRGALQQRWRTGSPWLLNHCGEETGREEQSSPTFDLQWQVSSVVHGYK